MTEKTSKIWIRLMAVLQLMTSLSFIQESILAYQSLMASQTALNGVNLAIGVLLSVLNLVAGWTLLDETKFALRFSLFNILLQTVSFNLPVFSYIYTGVARFYLSITLHGGSKPDLVFGAGFDILKSYFNVALSELPNLPTIAVSPIALAFVFYLSKRIRSNRSTAPNE